MAISLVVRKTLRNFPDAHTIRTFWISKQYSLSTLQQTAADEFFSSSKCYDIAVFHLHTCTSIVILNNKTIECWNSYFRHQMSSACSIELVRSHDYNWNTIVPEYIVRYSQIYRSKYVIALIFYNQCRWEKGTLHINQQSKGFGLWRRVVLW
jgi:hypothetical protein